MSRYWCVLQTYLWRPRFWVLGTIYLLLVWGMFWNMGFDYDYQRRSQALISAVFMSLAGCFLALHVRRQFATATAHLLPHFAAPHLVVAGLISALLWFFVPIAAILSGHWPPGALALHAGATLLMALVACWPKALVLLTAVPVVLIWSSRPEPRGQTPLLLLLTDGERPALAATLIVLAVIGQTVAAIVLLRLARKGVTTNDELTLDASASAQDMNPLSQWMLAARDGTAEQLMDARLARKVQRWRVPVATSWAQLAIPFVCVAGAAGVGWLLDDWRNWAAITTMITCAVLLLVPLAPWHVRRQTMAQELLRPVTRRRYFREIIASLVLDMALWMVVASTIIVVLALVLLWLDRSDRNAWMYCVAIGVPLALLWSMATFVFGVGLATMRWPMWLPIVAGIAMVWFFGVWIALVSARSGPRHGENPLPEFGMFVTLNVVVGLLLAASTYRRWLRGDVT